jgi:hypothetical protein
MKKQARGVLFNNGIALERRHLANGGFAGEGRRLRGAWQARNLEITH